MMRGMLFSCLLIVLHKCSQPNNTMTVFHAFVFFFKHSNPRCSPWLESDTTVAVSLVSLYTKLTVALHDKFKGKDVMAMVKVYLKTLIYFLKIHIQSSTTSNLTYYLVRSPVARTKRCVVASSHAVLQELHFSKNA